MFSFIYQRYQAALYLGTCLKKWDSEWISFSFGMTLTGFFFEGMAQKPLTEDEAAALLKQTKSYAREQTPITLVEMMPENGATLFRHYGEAAFEEEALTLDRLALVAKVGETPFLMPEWVNLEKSAPFDLKFIKFECEKSNEGYHIVIEGISGSSSKELKANEKLWKQGNKLPLFDLAKEGGYFFDGNKENPSPSGKFWEFKQNLKQVWASLISVEGFEIADCESTLPFLKGEGAAFIDKGGMNASEWVESPRLGTLLTLLPQIEHLFGKASLRVLCRNKKEAEKMASLLEKFSFPFEIELSETLPFAVEIYPFYSDFLGRWWSIGFLKGDFQKKGGKGRLSFFGPLEEAFFFLMARFEGKLPFIVAPIQIGIAALGEGSEAKKVLSRLIHRGYRAKIIKGNAPLAEKIYRAEKEGIPYTIVLGPEEEKKNILSIRCLGSKEKMVFSFEDFCTFLEKQLEKQQLENQSSN